MKIGILTHPPDLSDYVAEIFKTWGLAAFDRIGEEQVEALDPASTPVLVCPASERDVQTQEFLIDYARRGGAVVTFLPGDVLAHAAGLACEGTKAAPLRLRPSRFPAGGVSGEDFPVVGAAGHYIEKSDAGVGIAYLYHPDAFEGESVGIFETPYGKGRILAFAFDLPACVFTLRQGDPCQIERAVGGNVRADSIGIDLGPADSGLLPFADLLARWLVELVCRFVPAPVPLLWHLPGGAAALVLYSGDEDGAEISATEQEFREVSAAGARMSLYIIPIGTDSTAEDVQRYRQNHDVGPHPNLRAMDGRSIEDRVAEFERQILLFEEMYGFEPKSVRNHCLSWAGYMELVEAQARLGIRMDANYLCSAYMRDRCSGPYHLRGAAMPMRFCHPDGRLVDVLQQHTHLSDDVWFQESAPKSFHYSPEMYGVLADRILCDSATRFHVPYGVILHPGNWVRFSRPHGLVLLEKAAERNVPVWSYDQWCDFWLLRDRWRVARMSWQDHTLTFTATGATDDGNLRWLIPAAFGGEALTEVRVDGRQTPFEIVTRYGQDFAQVALGNGIDSCGISAVYS
ncbi:MAG: hypothetical protein J4F39_01315 [Candidatus Latescibacteria bacterium]|nr:hypothetical protein [Candidatus Latescibacterota bacterium]